MNREIASLLVLGSALLVVWFAGGLLVIDLVFRAMDLWQEILHKLHSSSLVFPTR